jgi:hypothetical protein
MHDQKSFWKRPIASTILHAGAYLVPLVVMFGGLPARMTAVETNQHEAKQKLDQLAEGVARIEGTLEGQHQRIATAR